MQWFTWGQAAQLWAKWPPQSTSGWIPPGWWLWLSMWCKCEGNPHQSNHTDLVYWLVPLNSICKDQPYLYNLRLGGTDTVLAMWSPKFYSLHKTVPLNWSTTVDLHIFGTGSTYCASGGTNQNKNWPKIKIKGPQSPVISTNTVVQDGDDGPSSMVESFDQAPSSYSLWK